MPLHVLSTTSRSSNMRIYIFTQKLGWLGNMSGFYFVVLSQVSFDKRFILDSAGWAHIQAGSCKGNGCLNSTTLGHSPSRDQAPSIPSLCHFPRGRYPLTSKGSHENCNQGNNGQRHLVWANSLNLSPRPLFL